VVAPHETGKRKLSAADSLILPSKTLRPDQRVRIYADAYMARLVGALEEDFPALSHLVGHRAFHRLCRAYLERFPSRSWSLNPLGRRLSDFLSRREAARDLAKVEVAMSEVFDGEGVEALKPADFAKIRPRKLALSRLELVPTFKLLELDHAVNPYIDAVRQEREAVPVLRRKRSWIAVYRKEFQVWRLDLKESAHAALSALQRGRTVAQSAAAASRVWKGKPADLQAQIRRWFGEWVSEGFFARMKR
jgi:PHD/YefM family antitoxin component YafN of YafNO toxin-antitoxin module